MGIEVHLQHLSRFLSNFFSGALFFLYADRIPQSRSFLSIAIVGFISLVGIGYVSIATPIFGGYIILYIAFSEKVPFQRFGKYGDASYGIYLYSYPVQQLLALYLGGRLSGMDMFACSLLLSVLLGMFSWHFIESPFLKMKRRL